MTNSTLKKILSIVYVALWVAFGVVYSMSSSPFTTLEWVLFALTISRLSRLVAFDKVLQPWRNPWVTVVRHPHYGHTTEAYYQNGGWEEALGELITCPICNGTWLSLGLGFFFVFFPSLRGMLFITGAGGAAELLYSMIEFGCWQAAAGRRTTGGK